MKKINILQLSQFTGVSRPTLIKYYNLYRTEQFSNIPAKYIELFKKAESDNNKIDLKLFCSQYFISNNKNNVLPDLVTILINNADKLDLRKYIKEIENDLEKQEADEAEFNLGE